MVDWQIPHSIAFCAVDTYPNSGLALGSYVKSIFPGGIDLLGIIFGGLYLTTGGGALSRLPSSSN